ncbi:MAG: VOC family protein [Bradyrhizobium sp.]|nr:VOC family protein [Bradyrhizobium sp.]MBV9969210.1 VOC family protein [Xanthobacteraceae bacterium]
MANEINPVGWFEIYVRDINRAKTFYETVLGTPLTKLPQSGDSLDDMWAFPMNQGASGAAGALAKMDGAAVGPGGTIVYFVTDDCATVARRAKQAGGQIVKEKFSIGQYGHIALVTDLDGNVIGLHSMT